MHACMCVDISAAVYPETSECRDQPTGCPIRGEVGHVGNGLLDGLQQSPVDVVAEEVIHRLCIAVGQKDRMAGTYPGCPGAATLVKSSTHKLDSV